MKKTIVLSLALIIGFYPSIAQNATSKTTSVNQQIELDKLQKRVNDAEKSFQDYFDKDKSLKSLKEPVKNNVKKHHENVKTALEAIIEMQQDQLTAYQDELSVFRFFSNTEETIFADSTLERNGWSKKLAGTYLKQYETISRIREVSISISEVEKTIIEETNNKEKNGLDDEKLKTIISCKIEAKMRNQIGRKIDDINKFDLSFLSDAQKEYYRKLRERFNDIFDKYL